MSTKLNQISNMQITTEDLRHFTHRKMCEFFDIYTRVCDSEAQLHQKISLCSNEFYLITICHVNKINPFSYFWLDIINHSLKHSILSCLVIHIFCSAKTEFQSSIKTQENCLIYVI